MQITAYVLIQTGPRKAKAAAEAISRIEGVKSAHTVTGLFDVIAFVEAADIATLTDLVLAKIQAVEGVERTQTAMIV